MLENSNKILITIFQVKHVCNQTFVQQFYFDEAMVNVYMCPKDHKLYTCPIILLSLSPNEELVCTTQSYSI